MRIPTHEGTSTMARIQILELPSEVVGEVVKTPFALVIDQVETEEISTFAEDVIRNTSELTQDEADTIARNIGAVGTILTRCTLDVA
jgi:hypothetical protein